PPLAFFCRRRGATRRRGTSMLHIQVKCVALTDHRPLAVKEIAFMKTLDFAKAPEPKSETLENTATYRAPRRVSLGTTVPWCNLALWAAISTAGHAGGEPPRLSRASLPYSVKRLGAFLAGACCCGWVGLRRDAPMPNVPQPAATVRQLHQGHASTWTD